MSEETLNLTWEKLYTEFELHKETPGFVEQLRIIFYIGAQSGIYLISKASKDKSQKARKALAKELKDFIKTAPDFLH